MLAWLTLAWRMLAWLALARSRRFPSQRARKLKRGGDLAETVVIGHRRELAAEVENVIRHLVGGDRFNQVVRSLGGRFLYHALLLITLRLQRKPCAYSPLSTLFFGELLCFSEATDAPPAPATR